MSFRAVAWALNDIHRVSPSEKLTLICLAEFANDDDQTWRSREEIAYRVGCTTRSLNDFFKSLENYGLISREPRYAWCGNDDPACASRGAHKHRSGTLYTLHLNVRRLPQAEPISTEEKISSVEEALELQGKVHKGKNFTCEDELASTGEKSRTPQVSISRTHMNIDPPSDPPKPYPSLPDPKEVTAQEGTVRSGQVGLSDEETRLIAECVPHAMQTLDVEGARLVASLLSERVAAGWLPSQINAILGAGALPARVHRMAGLVAARIRANIATDASPAVLRERAQAAKRQRREQLQALTEHAQDEPLTVANAFAGDPEKQAILRAILGENPEMTLTNAIIATTRTVLARKAS